MSAKVDQRQYNVNGHFSLFLSFMILYIPCYRAQPIYPLIVAHPHRLDTLPFRYSIMHLLRLSIHLHTRILYMNPNKHATKSTSRTDPSHHRPGFPETRRAFSSRTRRCTRRPLHSRSPPWPPSHNQSLRNSTSTRILPLRCLARRQSCIPISKLSRICIRASTFDLYNSLHTSMRWILIRTRTGYGIN